jgi:hypothetical protein
MSRPGCFGIDVKHESQHLTRMCEPVCRTSTQPCFRTIRSTCFAVICKARLPLLARSVNYPVQKSYSKALSLRPWMSSVRIGGEPFGPRFFRRRRGHSR